MKGHNVAPERVWASMGWRTNERAQAELKISLAANRAKNTHETHKSICCPNSRALVLRVRWCRVHVLGTEESQ